MNKANFGIIGLGVMGRSLAKNIAGKGFSLSVYNQMTESEKDVVPNFLKETEPLDIQGHTQLEPFVNSLLPPRKILLMVSAGEAVDSVISQLEPLLAGGDIIIDGGNSHYLDTRRRASDLSRNGIDFIGAGISGGERGALLGPSMMVSGNAARYEFVKPAFEAIAARDKNGRPCVSLLGPDGCGHFVKTVHNGIEYAEMQLLAECYALLSPTRSNDQIAALFKEWDRGELSSYLLEITVTILTKKEGDDYLLDKILDVAETKGTGSWSSQAAFQLGIPASMINAAVTARFISMLRDKRVQLASMINAETELIEIDEEALKKAYAFSRILNHYQGFEIMKAASEVNKWNLDLGEIARIWTQGCIIRSQLMERLAELFKLNDDLLNDSALVSEVKNDESAVNQILNNAFKQRLATPCISNSFQYWLSLTSERSPAHLIQAQRDYFGAHKYQRTDKPSTDYFTTNWTKNG